MLDFFIKNIECNFDYNGLKVFCVPNTTLFLRQLFISLQEGQFIKTEFNKYSKYIMVTPLTKINNLLSLNKTNNLYKKLLDLTQGKKILDEQELALIANTINEELQCDVLEENYDIAKLLSTVFNVVGDKYFDEDKLYNLLDFCKTDSKQLLILSDYVNLNLDKLYKYTNYYDFIIVTSKLNSAIYNIKQLETCVVWNDAHNYLEVLDKDKLYAYLEKNTNQLINDQVMDNYLKRSGDQLLNAKIDYFLWNIA